VLRRTRIALAWDRALQHAAAGRCEDALKEIQKVRENHSLSVASWGNIESAALKLVLLVKLGQFDSAASQIDEALLQASRLKDGPDKEYILAVIKVNGAVAHKQTHCEQPVPEKFLVDWRRVNFAATSPHLKRKFPLVLQHESRGS
jgi:hypothetical protein